MRRPLPLSLLIAATIALGACARATTPGRYAILIGLNEDGTVKVSVESLELKKGESPVVGWAAAPEVAGRHWIVAFGDDSPFKNGRIVFSSDKGADQAPIDAQADAETYKYWVFVTDGKGDWIHLDPKIVIIDDPGPDSVGVKR
ncbi:MAG TPA: hypothetical protein VJ997_11255 [Longimicrobiales bacterium]|nr:hypothetical protein [Longimicrobiales bacterium]